MLNKSQLMKVLVDLSAVNDVPILHQDRNLPIEICLPEDRQTVRKMAALVAYLLQTFQYERSPEFEEGLVGKSSAFVAMKRRLAADSLKRAEQRRRLESALGEVMSSDSAYALVPTELHGSIRALVDFAGGLRNPTV